MRTELTGPLLEHLRACPAMELEDGAKFLYQSVRGPSHLLEAPEHGLDSLRREWERLTPDSSLPLTLPLGGGYCRLDLRVCKAMGLASGTLWQLVLCSARPNSKSEVSLENALEALRALPFPPEETERFLARYRRSGCPPLHHSATYRAAYSPAYRVVRRELLYALPLLAAIDEALKRNGGPVRVALDGPCASGKTTLAALLERIYRCPVIPMDHFFLPPQLRTPRRLAQSGGNVDHARFQAQVLSPLLRNEPVCYAPFRCGSGDYGPEIRIPPAPLTVVEGVYSLRPDQRDAFHLRCFVSVPWETRRQRLLERGGTACLERFLTQWIPLEDRYFQDCRVQACCHLTLSPTGPLPPSP